MEVECRKNIEQLHVFIESWLQGSVEKSRLEFQNFEAALDKDFVIVHPGGELQTRPDIIRDFWQAHGVQSTSFTIAIRNISVRFVSGDICVMNYEEWQTGGEETARISTVIFRKSTVDNKISWLHLHETWCQGI